MFFSSMHPTTQHGVGVITQLHFAIFEAFKESMTLNLAQGHSRSYILAAIESQCTTLWAVNSSFCSIFIHLGDIAGFIHPSQLCK